MRSRLGWARHDHVLLTQGLRLSRRSVVQGFEKPTGIHITESSIIHFYRTMLSNGLLILNEGLIVCRLRI